jgi:hypothetical protein
MSCNVGDEVVLEVIGAGFGRTGTHSLKLALEVLGFGPCHHMFEIRQSADQLEVWKAIARTGSGDWHAALSGFKSLVDWPGVKYWKELAQAFPAAKIILTYRDPKSWYQSFAETIVRANRAGLYHDPDPHTRGMAELVDEVVFKQTFDNRPEDENHATAVYLRHMADVLTQIPKERLMFYNVAQGWQPLCTFLDVAVPSQEFPQTNSKTEFLARKKFLANLG